MRCLTFTFLFALSFGFASADDSPIEVDLCVIEATPAGVACAVRAAREGLSVVLVNRTSHPGGILSSGLGVWDTVWEGKRSPIYNELRQAIFDHYKETYGTDAQPYRDALPGTSGHTNGKFEPHVVEALISRMLDAETLIQGVFGFVPESVERQGRKIESVTIREFEGTRVKTIRAAVFADCSYEGDLLPLAKVAYRLGRESRDEFGEPHAGVVYMKPTKQRPKAITDELWKAHESLNLRSFPGFQELLMPESSGRSDGNVQAFNYRTILTDDPENRRAISRPENYDPEFLKTLESGSIVRPIPNQKIGWNRPQLIGLQQAWAEGSWKTRKQIMDAHWDATMSLLWFLQHDESVPEKNRTFWWNYGLAKNEFPDNGNRPYEIYVREARRLDARYLLTQHDLTPAPGTMRAPIHEDAIAMTDWYADSHGVTGRGNGVRGSLDEGKMMLHAETWPGQIPWRSLLPKEVDNLIVPVCLGASHVAWGAIRLEPTWMQTGEVAGWASVLAKRHSITPGELDPDLLVKRLASEGPFISFFNDTDVAASSPEVIASQFFGTKGFFAGYDARLAEPLGERVNDVWTAGFADLQNGILNPSELAKKVHAAEKNAQLPTESTRGTTLVEFWKKLTNNNELLPE